MGQLRDRLARCLLRLRAREGWTQREAAEAAGMDARHYRRLERGEVAARLDTLEALAHAFGLDASVLLRRVRE